MRYRRGMKVQDAIFAGAVVALVRRPGPGETVWTALCVIGIYASGMLISHHFRYWEVLSDRIVFSSRVGKKIAWLFSELEYVGPGPSAMAYPHWGRQWLFVRNKSGKRKAMDLPVADAKRFIAQMRQRAPTVTCELSADA